MEAAAEEPQVPQPEVLLALCGVLLGTGLVASFTSGMVRILAHE